MNETEPRDLDLLRRNIRDPGEDLARMAAVLKAKRQALGLRLKDMADLLGITYQSYQNYESGKAVPTLAHFIRLADLFDVSLEYLLGREKV